MNIAHLLLYRSHEILDTPSDILTILFENNANRSLAVRSFAVAENPFVPRNLRAPDTNRIVQSCLAHTARGHIYHLLADIANIAPRLISKTRSQSAGYEEQRHTTLSPSPDLGGGFHMRIWVRHQSSATTGRVRFSRLFHDIQRAADRHLDITARGNGIGCPRHDRHDRHDRHT